MHLKRVSTEALAAPLNQRIELLKAVAPTFASVVNKMTTSAGKVRMLIGKTGCSVTPEHVMNVDIEISHAYEAFTSALISNGFDGVVGLMSDMEQKNATEYALHLEAVAANGFTDAFTTVEDLSAHDCLSEYNMLPKDANTATALLFSATIALLHSFSKLMIAIGLGGNFFTQIVSQDLALALSSSLGPQCTDAKFVEVALSDTLTALNNVFRLY